MNKNTIFAAAATLVVGFATFQSMRTDAVSSEPQALTQAISPFDMMKNAHGLPVESVKNAV